MKEIDEYREQEAKEAEEKDGGEGNGGSATFGTGDISTLDTSTMVGGPGSNSTATGTINPQQQKESNQTSSDPTNNNKGTMVFSSGGTMVKHDKESGGNGGGTMVFNSGTMEMKQNKKKESKTNSQGTGTMVSKGGGGGSSSPAGEFMQYYRTGQSLDVDQNSSLLDLRMSLISLNKAYEDEMTALEQFYSKRRQQLKEMIAKKEKETSS